MNQVSLCSAVILSGLLGAVTEWLQHWIFSLKVRCLIPISGVLGGCRVEILQL